MKPPVWRPSRERIQNSNLTKFTALVNERYGLTISDFGGLHRLSIEQPDQFWTALWDYCEVIAEHRGDPVVTGYDHMLGAKWFPEARLNFARNFLRRQDDEIAIIALKESGERRVLSFSQLYELVSRYVLAMRHAGIGVGDKVAAFMPNVPEAVAGLLAATSIGAVWACCSPEFGVGAAVDRLGQIEPKLLLAGDGYSYGGKTFDVLGKVADIVAKMPSIKTTVMVPVMQTAPSLAGIRDAVMSDDFISPFEAGPIDFASLPFDHPVFILFSSGTTGAPKCIMHSAGGTLLETLKAQALHFDINWGDRYFCWTPTGWVTWNLHLFSLARGASIVIYDGSPLYPEKDAAIRMTAEERATMVRLTPKYVEELAKAGLEPSTKFDLSALKTIMCNGSPFTAEGYDYVYTKVKQDLHLISPSGGTDPFGAIVSSNPNEPVWAGEIQVPALGFQVAVFDDEGRTVVNQPGELVVTRPFLSMPIGFIGDADGSSYRRAYFEMYPDVWRQGDWALQAETGGYVIFGRSDTTLNARGLRIGTAEIYRQLSGVAEITECVAVGQEWESDTRIILFVQLNAGSVLDDPLDRRIKQAIRSNLSPRYVPAKIVAVPAIPRTVTGKVSEVAVTNAIHGRPVQNKESLANPDSLKYFVPGQLPALIN